MADKKISALTASTTPLAGTEVLPIVQSGATVKVAVSDLTSGRAVSMANLFLQGATLPAVGNPSISLRSADNVIYHQAGSANATVFLDSAQNTIAIIDKTTGVSVYGANFVVGTSGKGIDFSATPGTGTSELFNDYEEGTWTPTVGGTSTYSIQKASYIKVGRLVTVSFDMEIILLGTGSTVAISGLPFTAGTGTSPKFEQGFGASGYFQSLAVTVYMLTFYAAVNGTDIYAISTNSLGATANVNPAIYGNGTRVQGTVTYMATA
jgi:hypothetical protein